MLASYTPLARQILTEHFPNGAKWVALVYAVVSGILVTMCILALYLGSESPTCPAAGPDYYGLCRYLLLHQGDIAAAILGNLTPNATIPAA